MFEALTMRMRMRIESVVQRGVWAAVALVALLAALIFFGAAVFHLARAEFGTLPALLGFGGFFLAVALLAAIAISVARRNDRRRQAMFAQSGPAAAPWLDPRLLATGLTLTRTLGGRRALAIGLAGAFLVGLWLSRSVDRK